MFQRNSGNANLPIGSGFAPQIDIIEWFGVTREQVTAVLDFAARSLEVPVRDD
jgi:hypothetical protein